jgi:hypothetical protein
MPYDKAELVTLLESLDLGSSVAETDNLLEQAQVETSVFTDLFHDRVDLVPGTKGSGKSALYRIFVDFLPDYLLESRKVVIAHGVHRHGDNVFLAYNDTFDKMNEEEFVDFWCIYLVSLANEQFIKNSRYIEFIKDFPRETDAFHRACRSARIPEFPRPKPLQEVLGWTLGVLKSWRPQLRYRLPNGSEFNLDLFGQPSQPSASSDEDTDKSNLPQYVHNIKNTLEDLLKKDRLGLWLMIDRLDEIFPRRSSLETNALRGLLRTLRIFESQEIRVKVFLRDDILEQVSSGGQGFTALTHVTARSSDTLRWSEDQILTMIVKRLYANSHFRSYLKVDLDRLQASRQYQKDAFYKVFPSAVHRGEKQSSTLRWIYTHTQDGKGVVTPRDVIDLLTKAKQKQQDEFRLDPSGGSDFVIGPAAIEYGLVELSKRKKTSFLQAEFPHLWEHIKKLVGGKTEYGEASLKLLFGKQWESIVDDIISLGVLRKELRRDGSKTFKIPFLYRDGLEVTQGRA